MNPKQTLTGSDDSNKDEGDLWSNVEFQWGAQVPMRDGVYLNATVYRPTSGGPSPAIFTLTPYIADSYHERAAYFSRRGYAFLLVDCRGRGNSGGSFEPFACEAQDAYDVIEWLANQPWCDGQVAMWGGSYAGFNQWMALAQFPPHLRTVVPAAAAHAGVDFPFFKNIMFPYEMQWQTLTSGVTDNANLFADQAFWRSRFRDLYLSHRPFRELDRIVGNSSTHFQTWMEHPKPDVYWDRLALTPDQYAAINVPILTITGHYDGDQPGAMHYYRQHMRHGTPESRAKHFLIVGPWDHAGTRTPQPKFGGLEFGEASVVDLNQVHLEWYDWTMKAGPKPDFLKERVAYYLMGADEWNYAPSLEAISDTRKRLFLNSVDSRANDVFQSGMLEDAPPVDSLPDRYVYDPLDVRAEALERDEVPDYLTDQRYALNLYGNGLVYHSEPFPEDVEVTGSVRLVAWIALDVTDTDLQANLYEVLSNGTSILLARDYLRARHRESLREEVLVTPGAIERYEFDGFAFFSRQIARGSRMRLIVKSPNSIYVQKNYNSGGVVAEESGADARTAHVALYHDAEHPSYLELPIVT